MVSKYTEFLKSKATVVKASGFDVPIEELNDNAFEWQKYIVKWALKKGKCALFEDCGLGKTLQQLMFSYEVHRHTGNWNTGDCNTGFFNTHSQPLYIFNKPTDLTRDEILNFRGIKALSWNYENSWWIYSSNMTDEEKKSHPEHETTGGYLKTVDFKTACKMMWDSLDEEDKEAVRNLPNFDNDVFREITGISVEGENEQDK